MSSNSAYIRPISVMSLLADQMGSSSITENKPCDNDENGIPIDNSVPFVDYKVVDHSNSKVNINHSTSVPCNRHLTTDHECIVESDLLNSELPPKRKCQSVSSTNIHISRPIPIKMCANVTVSIPSLNKDQIDNPGPPQKPIDDQPKIFPFSRNSSNVNKKQIQRGHFATSLNRPVISANKKSAFISTRSLTSPHTSSSDYSISPDIESPTHRPDSVTSSGFHDCSQQSLLIDPNYSPDSNQRSGCTTIINSISKPSESATVVFPRCHSQPCYEPVSRSINNHSILIRTPKAFNCQSELNNMRTNSQFHMTLKRRYPLLTQISPTNQSDANSFRNSITPMQCCFKRIASSADTSPSAFGLAYSNCKRDGYFFGNGRNYLVSLPRIASSPTPISPQSNLNNQKEDAFKDSDQPESLNHHRQRIGSNSSSLSTSTTTDTTTPTVISNTNSLTYLKRPNGHLENSMSTNKENVEDIEMMDSDDYPIENRSSTKVKLDYHSHHNLSTNDGHYNNINMSSEKDQLQFWHEQNFRKSSRHSMSSCSVSVTSDMRTKSYSTNSDDSSNCTNPSDSIGNSNCESSRSEYRDPDDPPEIVGDNIVNSTTSIGFRFHQLTNHPDLMNYNDNSSFQELDIDQIELD